MFQHIIFKGIGNIVGCKCLYATLNKNNYESVSTFQIDITRPDTYPFVVTVEGVRGTSFTGDIAIDDITIFSGNCPQGLCVMNIYGLSQKSYDLHILLHLPRI